MTITAKELAERLTGLEYPVRIPAELAKQAKESGLVIVYGASDDLMEFEGAISDEVGAYEGATVEVDHKGIIPAYDDIDKEDKTAMKDYFAREGKGAKIAALWCAEPGYSFTYKTSIPHATFEITEDGEPYCRGIVFALPAPPEAQQ
jgi:hypothetical protein